MSATILGMRSLTNTHRLQALSVPEVTDEIDRLSLRYARSVPFQGRKLKTGPMLNAIVLNFLGLPPDQQRRALEEGVSRLEAILRDGEAEPATAPESEEPPPKVARDQPPKAQPATRRGKSR